MNQSSSAWSGEALALPGNRHKENDDFRKSATGKTKPGHKQIVSKGSLEVSRLRPRTNHDDNERTSSPKPIQQAPAAHQRQKSGGLGRRVLSKVTSAALRSKSVSRRANENHSDSSSTRLARLGTETGEINTSSRISNYTKDGFDGTETLHDMSYHAKSMKNNIAIYPSRGTVTAPYLEVTTSPDRSVTDKPGNRSLWVTIDVKAVQAGASAGASAGSGHYRLVAFSEPLQPNITNVLVEVIAAEGFEVAEIMGHTRYPLLYTGQSFTVLVRVMRASMTNKRRETSQPSDEDGFEELCSEIETLLSSKCIDAEVLSVKGLADLHHDAPWLELDTEVNGKGGNEVSRQPDEARKVWQHMRRLSRSRQGSGSLQLDRWRSSPSLSDRIESVGLVQSLRDIALANKRSVDEETLREWRDRTERGLATTHSAERPVRLESATSVPWL
ncbi:hypothetical protein ANO11243_077290 [Dothideomycetidae sp. 11243]|nr:hypothetical protein ANO11243_077290 [fungal sp. No.11243]